MFAELNNPPPSCFLLGINRPPDWGGGGGGGLIENLRYPLVITSLKRSKQGSNQLPFT